MKVGFCDTSTILRYKNYFAVQYDFAIQVRFCDTSTILRYNYDFAIQVRFCDKSTMLRYKYDFAIQVRLCDTSTVLPYKTLFCNQVGQIWSYRTLVKAPGSSRRDLAIEKDFRACLLQGPAFRCSVRTLFS